MSGSVNYASTPLGNVQALSAADATRTAPVNAKKLVDHTVNVSGAQVERITVTPIATVASATVVRIGLLVGATYSLLFEIAVPAQTLSLTSPVGTVTAEAVTQPNMFPLIVPVGADLVAWINDAVSVNVAAFGGAY
jgi:hypothetical protein